MKLKNRNSLKLKPFLSNLINKIRLFLQAIVSVIAKHTTTLKPQTVKLGLGLLGSFLIIALLTPIIVNIKSNQNSKALTPQVDRIYPNIGSPAGGDKVIIQGQNFVQQQSIHFTQISAGSGHTCALASDNKAYCWGSGGYGQLGNNSDSDQLTPVQVHQDQLPSSAHFTQISPGGSHACALASNNKAYCWGEGGEYGKLGNNTSGGTNKSTTPVQVHQGQLPSSAHFTQISPGGSYTCALASDNKAYCWGNGYYGQLGNNTSGDNNKSTTPIQVHQGQLPTSVHFTHISAGSTHTCALASDNKAYCWGEGEHGELGNGTSSYQYKQSTPVQVRQGQLPSSAHFTQISSGGSHTCALASDNKAYCWGYNFYNQLGNNSTSNYNSTTPVQVHQGQLPSSAHFTHISSGSSHTCALASDNKAYCWGSGYYGTLGNNSTSNQSTPVQVHQGELPSSAHFTHISSGSSHTCTLASDNKAYCWGSGFYGQLGNSSTGSQSTPVQVHQGQLPASQPGTQVLLNGQPLTIRYIDAHHLEITMPAHAEGKVDLTIKNPDNTQTVIANAYEYYDSTNKQPTITSLTPNILNATASNTQVALTGANLDTQKWKQSTAGYNHTCALASDNKAYCWGQGSAGQLGNGSTGNQSTPVQVHQDQLPTSAHFTQISAGSGHTCALASDNKAYCWGQGSAGQLGNNSTSNQLTPVQVHQGELPSSAHFTQISAGSGHTCALASDNKAYCWGDGFYGQLGDNQTGWEDYVEDLGLQQYPYNQLTPVQVHQGQLPTSAHFIQISAGINHTCALASDNKAYCWGSGNSGLLGNNSSFNQSTPVQVHQGQLPSSAHFIQISAGINHTCALASDNKAYCWGYGYYGQLGNNSNSYQSTPVQVHQGQLPSSAHFIQISAGYYHTCTLASDNKAYCWGSGSYGQLGNNTSGHSTYQSTPVQVHQGQLPTSAHFIHISTSDYHTCALASDNKAYCWGRGNDGQLGNNTSSSSTNQRTPVRVHDHLYSITAGTANATNTASLKDIQLSATNPNQLTFTMPSAAVANSTAPAPHTGPVNVSLTRQIDNVASTNQGTLTYYSTPPAPVSLTTHIEKPLNSLRLRWYSPSTGGLDNQANAGNNYSPITDYRVEYCIANTAKDNCQDPSNSNPTTANPSNWLIHSHSPLTSINNGFELSLAIPNLNHTNHYLFRVAAINQAGVGQYIQSQASLPSYVSLSLNQSNLSLNLNPTTANTYSSAKLTATINTNLNTGYSLKLSTASNNNSLVHTTLPNTQLNSINSTFQNPLPLQANTWGYYIPNTTANQQHNTISYNQFTTNNTVLTNQTIPTTKHSPIPNQANQQTIAQYNQPTTNKQLELIFGVAVDRGQLAGTYQQNIRLEVMGN